MTAARHRGPNRAARLLLLLLSFGMAFSRTPVAADAIPPEKKEETKPKILFAPEVESKLSEFLKNVKEAKRKILALRMKREIDKVAKITAINPERITALETAAQQPIDECVEVWLTKCEDYIRNFFQRSATDQATFFDRNSLIGDFANYPFTREIVQPEDQLSWSEALKRTLNGEQARALSKAQAERKQQLEREFGGLLKSMTQATLEQRRSAIFIKSADMKRTLELSKERAETLDALAKSAAQKSAADWAKRAEKMLYSMEDEPRRAILKARRGLFIPTEGTELPQQQTVWKDGLARLLNAEELQRVQDLQDERRTRRIRALGQIMLVELDQRIAFTADQRKLLQPIAERLLKDVFPSSEAESQNYYLQPQTFFAAGTKAADEELKPILDPIQWQHWKDACNPRNFGENSGDDAARGSEAAVGEKPTEPEDVEMRISDFLQEKAANERKQALAAMLLKAEDAGRVAELAPETIDRIKTAARGATEEALTGWKSGAAETVHTQISDATAENVKQRLIAIQEYNFESLNRRGGDAPANQAVWKNTVKAEMTTDQEAKWNKEVDDRSAFRDKSIASLVVAEFDRRNPISMDQWEKLERSVAGIMTQFAPDITNSFSSSESSRWYLQTYYLFTPLSGVAEKDFKGILSKDQWEGWICSNESVNGSRNWEYIQRAHAQRVKEGN